MTPGPGNKPQGIRHTKTKSKEEAESDMALAEVGEDKRNRPQQGDPQQTTKRKEIDRPKRAQRTGAPAQHKQRSRTNEPENMTTDR